ncbi:MAG TPA: hypothetical protein VL546_04555 [Steroidobacteraceae bacterium]|jgi:hypothetical protein|nr:hypothetical protein [Steroidobacteraceae bacterium]
MSRNRQPVATCSIVMILATTPVFASMRNASFGVSAQVVARTWIEPVYEPTTVELTSTDLLQGYKTLDVHYRVHTIGTSRYLLNIVPLAGLADYVHIDGLGAPVTLGESDITVLQQAPANVNELRLSLRLKLRPGLPAGSYSMPVRLSVSAS